jgi:hypothetical protein
MANDLSEARPAPSYEDALAGSSHVMASATGWSTVSQKQIVAMAYVIQVLQDALEQESLRD